MITAELAAYSIAPSGKKLATFLVEMPRSILAELNTHGQLRRNVESSRAIPFSSVKDKELFYPHFTPNQPGMQGYGQHKDPVLLEGQYYAPQLAYKMLYKTNLAMAEAFHRAGYHKQVYNRWLENFTFVRGYISATEWDNFFNLRIHHAAEPHIQRLAIFMYEQLSSQEPQLIPGGAWHIPHFKFIKPDSYRCNVTDEVHSEKDAIKIGLSLAAQVSYRRQDATLEKAEIIYEKLFPEGEPAHACYDSDTEVFTSEGWIAFKDLPSEANVAAVDYTSGEMSFENSPIVEYDYSGELVCGKSDTLDFRVTPNHRMLIQTRTSKGGIYSYSEPYIVEASELTDKQTRYQATSLLAGGTSGSYHEGKLWGLMLGDGYRSYGKIMFHLSKERKIKEITQTLSALGIFYTLIKDTQHINPNTVYISFHRGGIDLPRGIDKRTPEFLSRSLEYRQGLFSGLMATDGSVHHGGGFTYTTTSVGLAEDMVNLCTSLNTEAFITLSEQQGNRNVIYTVHIRPEGTYKTSRGITREQYEGKVYCASVSTGMLLVRRNGRQMVCGNSPSEHLATPGEDSGPFVGWMPYRRLIPNESCSRFTHEMFEERIKDIEERNGKRD